MKTRSVPGCPVFRRPLLILFAGVLLLGATAAAESADHDNLVIWKRIDGIKPIANVGAQVIQGIGPVSFPWTTSQGWAMVDLASGRYRYRVEGLAIGAMPTLLSPIGSSGVVTDVYASFVCTDGTSVDTPPVPLSAAGDASDRGVLTFDFDCAVEDSMFLLRVAEVLPGAPPIQDLWLAHGAVRETRRGKP